MNPFDELGDLAEGDIVLEAGIARAEARDDPHPYTVDVWLVGAEPYPCIICGKGREHHESGRTGD